MGRREQNIALLKLLLALAWADGRSHASELNFIKRLVMRFGLDDEIWAELEPYLEEPVAEAERLALANSLEEQLRRPGARREVLQLLDHMIQSDDEVVPAEQEALGQIRDVLQQDEAIGLLGGLKRLFGGGAGSRSSKELGRDVDTFLRNKVLYKLRRQLKQREAEVVADESKLSFWALFGGLLGRVVGADEVVQASEIEALRRILAGRSDLESEHQEMVVSIVQEEALRGLDRHRLIQGFLEVSTADQRRVLVSCLFDVATADGELPVKEHEEIRSIAYGLGLSHRQFIDAKVTFSSQLKKT